jgi:hypothetical protein
MNATKHAHAQVSSMAPQESLGSAGAHRAGARGSAQARLPEDVRRSRYGGGREQRPDELTAGWGGPKPPPI